MSAFYAIYKYEIINTVILLIILFIIRAFQLILRDDTVNLVNYPDNLI